MPSEAAHIDHAIHNQAVIDLLVPQLQEFPDWVATVAFYKALHIVEAVFSNDKGIGHEHSHEDRENRLKRNKSYEHIWRNYRPLWAASMVARYLERRGGQQYSSFSQYMLPTKVEHKLLRHHLRQVQQSAIQFLSAEGTRSLAQDTS